MIVQKALLSLTALLLAGAFCTHAGAQNYVAQSTSTDQPPTVQDSIVEHPLNVSDPGAITSTTRNDLNNHRIRVGLALGGGGSRGSAHVGVLKVLIEEGVPIDLIAGTSIGSVVGGFYSAGVSLDALAAEFDKDTFIKEFMPLALPTKLLLMPLSMPKKLFSHHSYAGIYGGNKFQKYSDRVTHFVRIEDLKIPFAAVCTNVVDGKSCRLTSGDLGRAMQASTAVPVLKAPVQIGDKLYCDGGVVCNVPVRHVSEMGADFVIAVDIDEPLSDVPIKTFQRTGSMAKQAVRILLSHADEPLLAKADIAIHPDTAGITLISRKKSDGQRGIDAGIKAAREAMPEIKRKLTALGVVLNK
ncbi:patatin-like phospholipase family protein [soil metagenome]